MLKHRVLTALVLAPLGIAAILFLPLSGFAMLWGAFILAAAWEWADLAGLEAKSGRASFVVLILAILWAAREFAIDWAPGELPAWFYGPAVAWWFLWGLAFRRIPERLLAIRYPMGVKLAAGAFVLVGAWILMAWLRKDFGQWQVLYLVLLIWLADIAAYFTGKNWGFTKLLEAISPGKTVEGLYGALAASAVLAIVAGLIAGLPALTIVDFVFLTLITVLASVYGDLFESLAKRIRGVKDSSSLLPGHGGVLDRIDSLLAAVSVFYAGSLLLGIFLQAGGTIDTGLSVQQEVPATQESGQIPGEKEVSPEEGGFAPAEVPAQPPSHPVPNADRAQEDPARPRPSSKP